MKFSNKKLKGKITPRSGAIKAYRASPGGLETSTYAALAYAKKDGKPKVVVQGNSYGSRVFHIANTNEDLKKYTVMSKEAHVYLVQPDGSVFEADALTEATQGKRHMEIWERRLRIAMGTTWEDELKEACLTEEFGKKITGGAPAKADPKAKPGTSMKEPEKETLPDPAEDDKDGLPPKTLSDPATPGDAKDNIEKEKDDEETAEGDPKAPGGEGPAKPEGGDAPPGGAPKGADPQAAQAAFDQKPTQDGSQPPMPDPTQSPAQATPQAPGAPQATMAPPAGNQGAPAAPAAAAPPAGGPPTPAAGVNPAAAPQPPQPASGPGVDPVKDPTSAAQPAPTPTDPTQAPAQASMTPPTAPGAPDGSQPPEGADGAQQQPEGPGAQPPGQNPPGAAQPAQDIPGGAGQPAQDAMGAAAQQGQPADPAAAPPGAPDPNVQQGQAPAPGPAGATPGAPGAAPPGAAPGAPDPAMGAQDPMQQGAPAQPGQAIPQGASTIQLVLRDDMEAQRAVEWLKSMGLGNTSANGNRILTFAATPEDMTVVTRTAQAFGLELSNQLV